jgi:hypothetical protein
MRVEPFDAVGAHAFVAVADAARDGDEFLLGRLFAGGCRFDGLRIDQKEIISAGDGFNERDGSWRQGRRLKWILSLSVFQDGFGMVRFAPCGLFIHARSLAPPEKMRGFGMTPTLVRELRLDEFEKSPPRVGRCYGFLRGPADAFR